MNKRPILLDKSDKQFIFIISIAFICVTIVALFFIFWLFKGTKFIENIVLVKDYQQGNGRIITDKTDFLSNVQGDINLKAEIPEGYLDPSEVFKQEEEVQNLGELIEYTITSEGDNPLEGINPGSRIKISEEEIIEEIKEPPTLEMLLELARQRRNRGRFDTTDNRISLSRAEGLFDFYEDLYPEQGLIILPLRVSWNNFEFLSHFTEFYQRYSDNLLFLYLNVTSVELSSENPPSIWAKFEEYDIPKNVPLYYDYGQALTYNLNINSNTGYILVNCDGFVYNRDFNTVNITLLDRVIEEMLEENKRFKAEDEQIIADFEAGLYKDIDLSNLEWDERFNRFVNLPNEILINNFDFN